MRLSFHGVQSGLVFRLRWRMPCGAGDMERSAGILALAGQENRDTLPPVHRNGTRNSIHLGEASHEGNYDSIYNHGMMRDDRRRMLFRLLDYPILRMRFSFHAYAASLAAVAMALPALAAHADALRPGQVFKDCDDCPEMVVIPAGSFDMGSPASVKLGNDSTRPVHRVTIKSAYALAKTEVTKRQWRAVIGVNPVGSSGSGDDSPVEKVSWNAAQEFVRRLNMKTGKQYRLPSEAEWEYACRAGTQQEYCGSDDVDSVAWHKSNSGGGPHPVAGKQANAFGLYDMSGNVWEWTADCWNHGYSGAPADGSAWLSGACSSRVIRGGSWYYTSQYLGSTVRAGSGVGDVGNSDGVRVARSLP